MRFQTLFTRFVLSLICLVFLSIAPQAQTLKKDYLNWIKIAADAGWTDYQPSIERWKKAPNHHELWGYDSPGGPIYLADLLGYLYQETKDRTYAEKARDILAGYSDLRETYPKEMQAKRLEYSDGVPAISNFFIMPPYARAYMRIRESGALDAKTKAKIEDALAFSLDFIFRFPEWGAHNRAMLRAESLAYGAKALANHPHAARWKQLGETLASDSMKQWEIEDATGYHGIWLYSVFSYADVSKRDDVLQSPMVRYYLDYFVQLLTPHGNIADFGDAHWNGGWERFVPVYEKAATLFRNPQYKYLAEQLTKRALERSAKSQNLTDLAKLNIGAGVGSAFTDAHRWADDSVKPQAPTNLSGDVLEDLIGKKVVFRNGWQPDSTMMLLNYRDEGDGGRLGRDFLRQTLSVEEEKMTHGHADENSIALLMSGGSVLLHDGGYRPDLPSGQYGAWRADYFHNRVVVRKDKRDKTQDVYEFLRGSGNYRSVRTQKIDFLNFKDVDVSRTRVIDDALGYEWDRVVTWVKEKNFFVVVDGMKALRNDYFTFTNLWHTLQIHSKDKQTFDTGVDKIYVDPLPTGKRLLVHFPENTFGKQIGTFPISRHYQDETAIYQSVSSLYKAGDYEYFVTILIPHDAGEDVRAKVNQFRLLEVDKAGKAIGLEFTDGAEKSVICIKLDLEMDLAREQVGPRYQYSLGKVKYGEFETDASYLFAKIKAGEVSYSAATMSKVIFRNQTLLEAKPTSFGLQLDGAPARTGLSKWRFWEDTAKIQ
ncbi:MAG TPA: hypothetical protein PLK30_03890 [Blastocatellia bacterium]|nr:hypothetical protein [Blastocatellia bacterium]